MKINVLLEGGLGDTILATRFVSAVRETYPDGHITAFVNNDNNTHFNTFLNEHWGYLWNDFSPDVERAAKSYSITSQFGQEDYPSAFENITPEWRKKILDADKFYNFHLDALDFLKYEDIPVAKVMKCVPRPRNIANVNTPKEKFAVLNLYARDGHFSAISKEASDSIIRGLKEMYPVIVIAPSEEVKETFYKEHQDVVRVADLEETLGIISRSSVGLSIDSGIRCMFYPFGKPCLTLCKLCQRPFEIQVSHQTRWYMWPEHMLPIETKPSYLTALVDSIMQNPSCGLYPQIQASVIDNQLIKRKYA